MTLADAFAKTQGPALEAFNAGDYERAFAGLADDIVWFMHEGVFDARVVQGRAAVIRFFESVRDAGDWIVETGSIEQLGANRVLVERHGTATGRVSRISGKIDFFQVWSFGADGLIHEVREYATREDALAAS